MTQNQTPSELDDGALLAYIEGAADGTTRRRIAELLASDPRLRAEFEELAALHGDLAGRLAHSHSPSSQELGEYILGLVGPKRAAEIERELAARPELRQEADHLAAYLAPEPAPPLQPAARVRAPNAAGRLQGRVKVLVAELLQGLAGAGQPAPAYAAASAVRGGESESLTYQVGDGQLILEARSTGAEGRSLLGLLAGFEQREVLVVELYDGDRLVASGACDELGNFALAGLSPATYDLVLRGNALEVIVPDVPVT